MCKLYNSLQKWLETPILSAVYFFVLAADDVAAAFVDQQIIRKFRFSIPRRYTCRKAGVGSFDVAIAVVDIDCGRKFLIFTKCGRSNSVSFSLPCRNRMPVGPLPDLGET